MAVQILTPGKLPSEKRLEGWCNTCGCHVRCTEADAWRGGHSRSFFLDCPTVLKKRRWWFDKKCPDFITLCRVRN
jgi:hypothetical protein